MLDGAPTAAEWDNGCVIGDRWGVTEAEVRRRYPCDEFVPAPALQAWRGVPVDATPDQLWPWVTQVRLAPYSYDWIDNLGRPSPRELRPLHEPTVGEHFTAAGGKQLGRILSVTPASSSPDGSAASSCPTSLRPQGDRTRLLLKLASSSWRWTAPLLSVGDLVMARRQLLNFKRLAEHLHH